MPDNARTPQTPLEISVGMPRARTSACRSLTAVERPSVGSRSWPPVGRIRCPPTLGQPQACRTLPRVTVEGVESVFTQEGRRILRCQRSPGDNRWSLQEDRRDPDTLAVMHGSSVTGDCSSPPRVGQRRRPTSAHLDRTLRPVPRPGRLRPGVSPIADACLDPSMFLGQLWGSASGRPPAASATLWRLPR